MKIDISNEQYHLRNLYVIDLTKILNWLKFNEDGHFVKNKEDITIDSLKKEYSKLVESETGFFLGIYQKSTNTLAGYASGEILRNKKTLFISSIMVDKLKRKIHIGTKLTNLLIDYMRSNHSIKQVLVSVDKMNGIGVKFWRSLGFSIYASKHIENEKTKENREVLILNKKF